VYIAISPMIPFVKIGSWRGTRQKLRSRYATYYGRRVEIQSFKSNDCRLLEQIVHKVFTKYKIENELFVTRKEKSKCGRDETGQEDERALGL
jgi:hypothetical protein